MTNSTSGGSPEQVRYLVSQVRLEQFLIIIMLLHLILSDHHQLQCNIFQGCIPPLCELLTVMDAKVVQVALNGLENLLRIGEQDARASGPGGVNLMAVSIEECYGMALNLIDVFKFC